MSTFFIQQFGCRATQADRDAIRKIHAANPATRIMVTGCYAQRAPEEIAALPGVSFVVGNSHKPQIPRLLHSISRVPGNLLVGAELAPPARSIGQTLPLHPAPILTGNIFELTDVLVAP